MQTIRTENLTKVYKNFRKSILALSNLNLTVQQGEIFGFLGPNGAGKTTTIKLLLNLLKPTSGHAFIFGKETFSKESRYKIGYLPENPHFYDFLYARDIINARINLHHIDKKEGQKRANELFDFLGLKNIDRLALRKYSKGMIQKIGIIQAIVHKPGLLILDEPTSGLDPVGRKKVRELLLSLKQEGTTIFFSSHILHDVETICDRIGIIVKGELSFTGTTGEIMRKGISDYEIVADGLSDEAASFLGHYNLRREGEFYRITLAKDEVGKIIDYLRQHNANIVSLEPSASPLERIFLETIEKKH